MRLQCQRSGLRRRWRSWLTRLLHASHAEPARRSASPAPGSIESDGTREEANEDGPSMQRSRRLVSCGPPSQDAGDVRGDNVADGFSSSLCHAFMATLLVGTTGVITWHVSGINDSYSSHCRPAGVGETRRVGTGVGSAPGKEPLWKACFVYSLRLMTRMIPRSTTNFVPPCRASGFHLTGHQFTRTMASWTQCCFTLSLWVRGGRCNHRAQLSFNLDRKFNKRRPGALQCFFEPRAAKSIPASHLRLLSISCPYTNTSYFASRSCAAN